MHMRRILLSQLQRRLEAHACRVLRRSPERERLAVFFKNVSTLFLSRQAAWTWPAHMKPVLKFVAMDFAESSARYGRARADIADLARCTRRLPASQLRARLARFAASQAALQRREAESVRKLSYIMHRYVIPHVPSWQSRWFAHRTGA